MVGRVLMTRRSHKLKLRSRRLNGRRKEWGGGWEEVAFFKLVTLENEIL